MRFHHLSVIFAALLCQPAFADGEQAGDFDYYVLAMSWSPNWCALEGDERGAPECEKGTRRGWSLHGLWPQYERGWPSYCRTPHREATRGQTRAMTDLMGSAGLAWHQWKKHGRCSGLSAEGYFEQSRQAFENVTRPDVFRQLSKMVRLPASVVEKAFLIENPDLTADGLTVTCRADFIQEVRICLTKGLQPRRCGADVLRDCSLSNAQFTPIR